MRRSSSSPSAARAASIVEAGDGSFAISSALRPLPRSAMLTQAASIRRAAIVSRMTRGEVRPRSARGDHASTSAPRLPGSSRPLRSGHGVRPTGFESFHAMLSASNADPSSPCATPAQPGSVASLCPYSSPKKTLVSASSNPWTGDNRSGSWRPRHGAATRGSANEVERSARRYATSAVSGSIDSPCLFGPDAGRVDRSRRASERRLAEFRATFDRPRLRRGGA